MCPAEFRTNEKILRGLHFSWYSCFSLVDIMDTHKGTSTAMAAFYIYILNIENSKLLTELFNPNPSQYVPFFLYQGMAVAARSQGKHKQRIWVNISLSGIKIIDERSGVSAVIFLCHYHLLLSGTAHQNLFLLKTQVIEHEHVVNKISFIARDVTDNRAFGYVCGAEGQHQFFAIKTGQQVTATAHRLTNWNNSQ